MKTLFALSILLMTGCVSYSPARMVTAKLKPTKSGVMQMPTGIQARSFKRKEAAELMAKFCAPQRPEVLEVNNTEKSVGAVTQRLTNNVAWSKDRTEEQQFVTFQCTDDQSATAELDF